MEDVKPVLLKQNGFQPATILRRRIFTRMNCEEADFSWLSSKVSQTLVFDL
jgi:hypothetical protein